MKMINKKSLLVLLALSLWGLLSAQSMRYANGDEFARKIGENLYEPVPAGVVSYRLEDGKFWLLFNGVSASEQPKGYSQTVDGKVLFFDSNDDSVVGYYVPAEGRYYKALATGSKVTKNDSYAVLFQGILYVGNTRYSVDEGFTPEAVGFFIFIH